MVLTINECSLCRLNWRKIAKKSQFVFFFSAVVIIQYEATTNAEQCFVIRLTDTDMFSFQHLRHSFTEHTTRIERAARRINVHTQHTNYVHSIHSLKQAKIINKNT